MHCNEGIELTKQRASGQVNGAKLQLLLISKWSKVVTCAQNRQTFESVDTVFCANTVECTYKLNCICSVYKLSLWQIQQIQIMENLIIIHSCSETISLLGRK